MGAMILGLGAGLAAHMVYGLLDAISLGAKPGFLWWWLLGLIASLYRLQVSVVSCQVSGVRDQGTEDRLQGVGRAEA